VVDLDRAREIRDEDEARLQQPDEQRLTVGVVIRDLPAELADAGGDLLGAEIDLADPRVGL
jgi:hypothetical protein